MDSFIATAQNFILEAQKPAVILGAVAYLFAFYLLFLGGDDGRRKAKPWFIWTTVALVGINSVVVLANLVDSKITF